MSLHFDVSNFNFNSQVLNSNHRRSLCELFTMAGLHLEPTSLGCCQVSGRGEIYGRNGWEQEEKVGFPLGNPKVPDFRGCLSHIFSPLRQFATSERRIHGTLILWRWIALFCHFSFLLNFPFLTWRKKKLNHWGETYQIIWYGKMSTFDCKISNCQLLVWKKTSVVKISSVYSEIRHVLFQVEFAYDGGPLDVSRFGSYERRYQEWTRGVFIFEFSSVSCKCFKLDRLLMEEILHHLGYINLINHGINYISTG